MKRERLAVYNNKTYTADFIKGKGTVLRSKDRGDIDESGFQECDALGHVTSETDGSGY